VAAPNLYRVHPYLRTIARNLPRVASKYGFQVRITSGYRSKQTQARLYNDYISGRSQYPASPPGMSAHNFGMALDIISTNTEALVNMLTQAGLQWAGPKDPIHFQLPGKIASRTRVVRKVQRVKGGARAFVDKVLDYTSWIPGPIGWTSMIADIFI